MISDTHVNPDEDECNSPFPVNARANRRFRHVASDLNRRDIEFIIHLGDLVHPVPETGEDYTRAANAYRAIAGDLRVPIHHIPGNHDVGDTPLSGAPASPVTEAMIAAWTEEFGDQYGDFAHDGIRFVLLNAQLINSGLADEKKQRDWLEKKLAQNDERVFLMLHHPAYLCFPDETGHYDNTNPPGREWLLGLVEKHGIEAMFSGHAHNFWYDRYAATDFYLAPAVSFVRQDYSEMFRIPPAPDSEHGRDDRAKLGYFIVRVFETGHSVQFVRTYGAELDAGGEPQEVSALALPPVENPAPRIGFDLRQNWCEISEVPPSGGLDEFDRKTVRNDYPLLALMEMGIRDIRIPLTDLRCPIRRARLKILNHLGMRPTLFGFGIPADSDLALIEACRDCLVDWEITIDWQRLDEISNGLAAIHERTGLAVYLSRLRSKSDLLPGEKYYHVINHGFTPDDGAQLDRLAGLKKEKEGVAGAVFRLGNKLEVSKTLESINRECESRGLRASVHMRLGSDSPVEAHDDEETICRRMGEVLERVPSLKAVRVFCDTLADSDRGYSVRPGAIDRKGNPRALSDLIRAVHAAAK